MFFLVSKSCFCWIFSAMTEAPGLSKFSMDFSWSLATAESWMDFWALKMARKAPWGKFCRALNMGVSKNRGTPKSSILIGFSLINHPFLGYPYFWKHPLWGLSFGIMVTSDLKKCPFRRTGDESWISIGHWSLVSSWHSLKVHGPSTKKTAFAHSLPSKVRVEEETRPDYERIFH